MSLYANYLGVRFVETAARGFTIAVGDMRAVVGGGDNAQVEPNWRPEYWPAMASQRGCRHPRFQFRFENQFGTDLFRSFMQGIGVLLGRLGSSEELPNLTVQSNQPINQPGIATEMVFPGNADIVHGQFVHRPEVKISIYIDSSCRKVVCSRSRPLPNASKTQAFWTPFCDSTSSSRTDRFWRSPATTITSAKTR